MIFMKKVLDEKFIKWLSNKKGEDERIGNLSVLN